VFAPRTAGNRQPVLSGRTFGWDLITKERNAAATGLYIYNYVYVFLVLFLLSLMHVLLEFPLNSISIRQLGAAIGGSLLRPVRAFSER
jgi:hypothetical protein